MTGLFKWIGAFAGYALTKSFWGAFFGFLIGGFIDNFQRAAHLMNQRAQGGGGNSSYRTPEEIFELYRRQQSGAGSDFPSMLMVLSAAVMKADGKVVKSELNFVKQFLSNQFGAAFTPNHMETLRNYVLDKEPIPLQATCQTLARHTQPQIRVQLLHYLFGIGMADGNLSSMEIDKISSIASMLGLHPSQFNEVKEKFHRDTGKDYTVLGITKDSTEAEIKKAYRKLAVQYHPDKVGSLNESEQNLAANKFREIQEAYDGIKKERGIS